MLLHIYTQRKKLSTKQFSTKVKINDARKGVSLDFIRIEKKRLQWTRLRNVLEIDL
jgi:hypothetical protein